MTTQGDCPSLLVVVSELDPLHASETDKEGPVLSLCLSNLLVFINTYLMFNHENRLAFIATTPSECSFLYPLNVNKPDSSGSTEDDLMPGKCGQYELFEDINSTITRGLKAVARRMNSGVTTRPLLAGALAKSLCYIHKHTTDKDNRLLPRILVMKSSPDSPSQYMPTMNCIFAAQKNSIPIDACLIDSDSGFLQQACDLTGGTYIRLPETKALLQYLLWVFLPDHSSRQMLTLPPLGHVDYRAACFCHRKLVEIGYVCSVCLSIFCQFNPICSTCNTRFPVPGLAGSKAKRKKTTQ
ncbi:general transcription factor IIH subunit 3-like [Corticium candelabrum]|uniref:general transcription factor IIH subunit 3-like n=1 Tax=Corticium candelabrum TaxID=121492 RepID=UPI002E25496F|nr:general transcription factor IIH subunit 3-like [Corticium candelabrum]XP_062504982.1 general transcription factor IIH subunit 3-like [Corticium candelabrum]